MVGVLGCGNSALAHDHHQPKTFALAGSQSQKGSLRGFTWTRPTGTDECVAGHADGVLKFPEALAAGPSPRAIKLEILKEQKPHSFRIRLWRKVDAGGFPEGDARVLGARLIPRGRSNDRRWLLRTKKQDPAEGDLYVALSARWRDTEGCGGIQRALWAFHLSL